jgi:AcrR family transcriptional regulator
MAQQKRDSEFRREQIAEVALEVIQQHGLNGFNVERVAARVDLVPSALYRHFQNKDDILDAVIEMIRDRLMLIVGEAKEAEQTPLARLRGLLKRHILLVQYFQAIPRVLFSDQVFVGNPARKAKVHDLIMGYLGQVGEIIAEGQDDGSIRKDIPSETLSALFLGLFQPSAMLWILSDGGFDVSRHIERAWRVFCEGVCPVGDGVK